MHFSCLVQLCTLSANCDSDSPIHWTCRSILSNYLNSIKPPLLLISVADFFVFFSSPLPPIIDTSSAIIITVESNNRLTFLRHIASCRSSHEKSHKSNLWRRLLELQSNTNRLFVALLLNHSPPASNSDSDQEKPSQRSQRVSQSLSPYLTIVIIIIVSYHRPM